jgi:hypothetical protein
MAIRRTWLLPGGLDPNVVAARFFIGLPLTHNKATDAAEDARQVAVAAEALLFGDVAFLNLADHYLATPIKVHSCTLAPVWSKAKDDVRIRSPVPR